jgi:hypothetical protein
VKNMPGCIDSLLNARRGSRPNIAEPMKPKLAPNITNIEIINAHADTNVSDDMGWCE